MQIWGAQLQVIQGHVLPMVAKLLPVSEVEGNNRLNLAIGLPLRNPQTLTNLLEQLYNPASPNFRQFLTPQQFAERFGPTEQQYQTVIDFAKSNRLVLVGVHPNRLLLDVNGSAADIERAFHIKLHVYRHPAEPRNFFSPDVDPSADSYVPILSIAGLDDFFLPRPMDLRAQLDRNRTAERRLLPQKAGRVVTSNLKQAKAVLDATGSGPTGTFIGSDFRAAYAPGVTLDGSGESVGLLELDSYYLGDISEYQDLAGLPQVPLTNVLVNGFNGLPGSNNGEVALDIEMAVSMAPGLARLIVYEGNNGNDVLNRMATDNQARQLSSSWSFGKPVDAAREQIFQQMAAQGQSFFQASGDSGAYGSVFFPPSDDPFVTAVGGTSLVTARPGGAWQSESAWSGSGGGVSSSYAIPLWQQSVSMTGNLGSTTKRNVPDVSALADASIWAIVNNGEQVTVSGTSAAAPLWAGFAALVNQQAAMTHQPGIGFLNPAIYAIGQGPAYTSAFHDITAGNNTNDISPDRFYSVTGYDLCTGWGTPNGSNMVNALLAPRDALLISPGSDLFTTGPVGGPFTPSLLPLSLSNLGSNAVSWALNSTSGWLNVSPGGGILVPGVPGATISINLNIAASQLSPGSYTALLWFTNLNNGFAQERKVVLAIVTPPNITTQPISQTLPAGASARFAVGVSTNAILSYQWLLNGTNLQDSASVTGSASPILSISDVSPREEGTYSVVVSNSAGVAASLDAFLVVTSSPPIIAAQPRGQTVLPGIAASFSVSAFGDEPLSYQWLANGSNLVDAGNVSGSATRTLTLAAVSSGDAKTYSVVVSNALGRQTSVEAELKVIPLTSAELVQSLIYSFNGTNGGHPNGLTRGLDGKIYGTTQTGGGKNSGTIFQWDASDQPRVLYFFGGLSDGDRPNGELIQDTDGSLLGTTYGGGSNAFGTIFRLNTQAQLTTLFTLDHTNGVLPSAGLVRGRDGGLYGTAYEGGIFHYGTIFRLDTNGGFAVVFPFANTNGAFPHAGFLRAADSSLYGTTYKGGAYDNGTIFRISPGGALSTMAAFNGTNGAFPLAGLVQTEDGSLYGTTAFGGAFGLGNIYRIFPDGLLTNLFSFTGIADGSHPLAGLIQSSDGNLYGTTSDGGAFGAGTVFRLSPEGSLITIAQFDGFNGTDPDAPLLEDTDGSLLGVTRSGGPFGEGVIFRLSIPSAGPQISSQPASLTIYAGSTATLTVASFGSSPLHYQWQEGGTNLIDIGNTQGSNTRTLVLTNVSPADSGNYSVIISNSLGSVLSSQASLQVLSSAPLMTLQPTNQTLAPGSTAVLHARVLGNVPLVYQWQVNGTNLSDTGNRSGSTTDTLVITNVTEADNGSYLLSVTNNLGSTQSAAAILSVIPASAPGTRLHTLYSFTGRGDGRNPSELVDGHDGFLYGTTQLGGTFSDGSAFKVGTNGGLTTLVSFDLTNGGFPLAGMILSTNGYLYGTTSVGGASSAGTVWSMNPNGALSNFFSFTGGLDGATPAVTLARSTDGSLYGSTKDGGASGLGNIFRITPQGTLTNLYSFSGGVDGASLGGPLIELSDANFYGTSPGGGTFGQGSVFQLSPSGAFTTLYSFTGGTDGYNPVGSLVSGDDGALYGATMFNSIRGFAFYGTLFKIDTNGLLTTLYALNFTDGSYPAAGLVLAADGNFYGTTKQGGVNDYGTLFRMTPEGIVSTLVEFDGFNDGANPRTALTQAGDGNLYGTTSAGGPGGRGTIFRLSFTGPLQITAQPGSQTGFTDSAAAFSVAFTGANPIFYQWQKDGTNLSDGAFVRGSSSRVLTLSKLQLANAGNYSLIVSNVFGSVASIPALLTMRVSAPVFQGISRIGANLALVWSSAAGRSYQLQSSIGLPSSIWNNIGTPFTATGQTLETSVPIGSDAGRFYRVVLLP